MVLFFSHISLVFHLISAGVDERWPRWCSIYLFFFNFSFLIRLICLQWVEEKSDLISFDQLWMRWRHVIWLPSIFAFHFSGIFINFDLWSRFIQRILNLNNKKHTLRINSKFFYANHGIFNNRRRNKFPLNWRE